VARGEGVGRVAAAETAAGDVRSDRERRSWPGTLALLSGPLFWLLVFFVLPLFIVAAYSVGLLSLFPTTDTGVSFFDWKRLFSGSSVYMELFWKSVRMALTVSVVVVLLAYPVGYYLALVAGKRKYVLLLLIIAPFLTSYLLRVLAWRLILGAEGVVNSLLFNIGVRQEGDPVQWLIYSQFTVILVLIYVWVPFVALPIFVSLENLDPSLLEAGGDLGASRMRVFWRVTLPLSLPGVAAAFAFVFIPTLGEFVTPSLVGGPTGTMFGNAISELFLKGLDWQTGSVLALFLVLVVGILMLATSRFTQPRAVEAI
jgi:spermidine/putrescine transport system permease protein